MKKKIKRMIRNFILFIALIILTFSIILKDQDITEIYGILIDSKKQYILIAILAMSIYVLCEAINIRRILKTLGEKRNIFQNIKYALIGFFFSGITPAASGGQPLQIYYMNKDNITVAKSTLTLLINLSSMQVVTISLALISFAINHNYLNSTLTVLFVIGIILNATALALLLISIFSKKTLQKLIGFVVKIMKKIKIKNADKKQEKIETELKKYHESSDFIKNNKLLIFKTLLTTYIQFIAFYSVSYWVYRSLGLNQNSIFQLITLQSILYGTVSGIPSPGAVGVSEGGFIEIFKAVISENMINSAMLLNRGINFYFLIIIGGIVTVISIFRKKRRKEDLLKNTD